MILGETMRKVSLGESVWGKGLRVSKGERQMNLGDRI